MHVLHYCRAFSPLSQTFVYSYVRELERQDDDNHVVTHHRENRESRPFPNVTVVNRPHRWHPRRLWHRALVPFGIGEARTSDWPQTRDRLVAAIREIDPAVIHTHFGQAGVLVAPVARRLEIPLVVSFYGHDISALPEKTFWRDAYADLWTQADAVTVLSEDMKLNAERLGCPPEKLNVVHLSRDLDQFPFRPPNRPAQTVLFTGRFAPKKAPLDAIRAVEAANAKGAGLQLHMVGDGLRMNEAEQYVREHDLSDQITFHGEVPNEEVATHMKTADAFILPSKTTPSGAQEGTPTVLVEAQATGLPCVTTRHAGIPEMIPEGHHDLLVEEGDVDGHADSLCRVSSWSVEELKERAERGRRKVEQEFNLSREVKKLRRIYKGIIAIRA